MWFTARRVAVTTAALAALVLTVVTGGSVNTEPSWTFTGATVFAQQSATITSSGSGNGTNQSVSYH